MLNYSRFFNNIASNRRENSVQIIPKLYEMASEGTILMGEGQPNPSTFPLSKVTVKITDNHEFCIEGKKLEDALQYQPTAGYTPLIEKLKKMQSEIHNLSDNYWDKNDLIITCGSLDGICKTFEMFLKPNDSIIMQEPLFTSIILGVLSFEPKLIAAEQDEFGVIPFKLHNMLAAMKAKKLDLPKVIYLNPTSSNPCGTTLPEYRRKEIYKIACEYDLIIMEDDPYYFITFEDKPPSSFLSMDTEERVLRYDSFSKIMSSGMRLGYVTGSKIFINKLIYHMQVSMMHACSLNMVILDELLNNWGKEKLYKHFEFIRNFYKKRRDFAMKCAEKYLNGIAEWSVPKGGMFLWLKFPKFTNMTPFVGLYGLEYKTITISGQSFMLNTDSKSQYIRVSFSIVSLDDMDQGFARLGNFLKLKLKDDAQE